MSSVEHIVKFIRHHVGDKPAIIGLSGGVDSAVVAYLLHKALGGSQVHGLILPSTTTSAIDIKHSHMVADGLQIQTKEVSISHIQKAFHEASGYFDNANAAANIQSRIRMSLLYAAANSLGGLVVGTGNKTELEIGYFTKFGDGGIDLLPIGHLYKKQVWELAKELGVPQDIITKAPTAGLSDGQTDEADIGMSYEKLDSILESLVEGQDTSGFEVDLVTRVVQLRAESRHKLQMPPIPVSQNTTNTL